ALFLNAAATTDLYTLSLHDALPISSRYNEWGEPRADFQLADVFGAHVAGEVIGLQGNTYSRIEMQHPVLRGFDGTALLPGAEARSEEHTSELQSRSDLVCRLLLEKK